MKKYITLLIALAMTSSFAIADDHPVRPERSARPTLQHQFDRINEMLDDLEPASKRAIYLNQRLAILTIQKDFRAKVKEKITDEMNREDRHLAMKELRGDFVDQMHALKTSRRAFFKERRELRDRTTTDDE